MITPHTAQPPYQWHSHAHPTSATVDLEICRDSEFFGVTGGTGLAGSCYLINVLYCVENVFVSGLTINHTGPHRTVPDHIEGLFGLYVPIIGDQHRWPVGSGSVLVVVLLKLCVLFCVLLLLNKICCCCCVVVVSIHIAVDFV